MMSYPKEMVTDRQLLLRPVKESDMVFLNMLYHSTREEEMALVDWPEQQKQDFLNMQFSAQHQYYMKYYADADYDIIELDGEQVGRLYLDRRKDEIRIVDIALLPEYRGKGIGTHYLDEIMAEAKEKKVPVRIHMESFNPALSFYQRLGFKNIDTNGVYNLMEWLPVE